MGTNNYFRNFNSFPQQELLNSLTKEVIQINGVECMYLVKSATTAKDKIFNEDVTARFTSAKKMEMYINTPEGFEGAGDVVSKFGLDVQDELNVIVHKERFSEEADLLTPREGDLIYLPLGKGLYEVKFVEHEKPFYTLGKNTVYELNCELFRYNNQLFDIPDMEMGAIFNKVERENATTRKFVMGGIDVYKVGENIFQGASLETATASAKVSSQSGATINVYRVGGTFQIGVPVVGEKSEVSNNLISVDDQVIATSAFSDNEEFETDGDNVLDFSEIDPWSEGDL